MAVLVGCVGDLTQGPVDGQRPGGDPDARSVPGEPVEAEPVFEDGSSFVGEAPQPNRDGEAEPAPCVPGPAVPTTRLVRLTHTQYNHAVRDILGLDLSPADAFLSDATFSGFDNSAEGLVVPDRLARDYRRAAEMLAAAAVDDDAARKHLVDCDPGAPACVEATLARVGRRVFRRPLSTEEMDAYRVLFGRGDSLTGSRGPFWEGLSLVLEAMLQSPKFLYRVELSDAADDSGFVTLSGFELATRLSFMLWNTTPDDALLDRAERGELDTADGVAAAAAEMLEAPQARAVLDDFARQWLDFARFEDLQKDASQFPTFQSSLGEHMAEEVRLFLRDVVFEQAGSFAELYTRPSTFVSDALAPYYGLQPTGDAGFQRVDLDPARRAGLLTQIGFLASHAFTDRSSPIHRGVFVHRRILCSNLPDPPGDVDFNLPPIEGEIRTTRQQVEVHTSPDACVGCHGVINPVGFAFEHFDAVGQYRDLDHGEPVDASGSLRLDGQVQQFTGAVEFSERVAQSPAARRCFATQYLRYAYGRSDGAEDRCTLDYFEDRLGEPGYAIKDLLLDLTKTRAFQRRVIEEAP